jgi:chromosome partitioning protein
MKVIAVSSAKGGVGKSTICVHLAVAAEAAGLATAIFDLDPQASVALWSDHRDEPIPAVVAAQAPRLPGLLKQARDRGADVVLLDTPPHASGVSADACALADVVLVPCRPSAFDLDSVGASIRVATTAKKPVWVVINAAPTQGTEVAETRDALQAAGVTVAPTVIHQRKAFSARAHEGRTALEFEPGGKAAREIEDLLSWLSGVTGFLLDRGTEVDSEDVSGVASKPATPAPSVPATKGPVNGGSRVAGAASSKGPRDTGTKKPRSRATAVACSLGPPAARYAATKVPRDLGGPRGRDAGGVVAEEHGNAVHSEAATSKASYPGRKGVAQ